MAGGTNISRSVERGVLKKTDSGNGTNFRNAAAEFYKPRPQAFAPCKLRALSVDRSFVFGENAVAVDDRGEGPDLIISMWLKDVCVG